MATIADKAEWRDNKRQHNLDFLSLSLEERAALTSKHPTQCHLWANFIPEAMLSTIDPDDKAELRRWNRIFHYQKHPFHRPPMPTEGTLYGQRVMFKRHILYGQIITDIDTSEEPTVGQMITEEGVEYGVVLVDVYEHIWKMVNVTNL